MIQCSECEHFVRGPGGQIRFTCDPFSNIKEPQCLMKWQLIKIDMMVQAYQATVAMYKKLAPMQERMLRQMEQEMGELDEADRWEYGFDDEDEPEEDNDLQP